MKQVSVNTWCDACIEEDDAHVPGETTPPLVMGRAARPRTLDLCERHRKEFIEPLSALLTSRGVMLDRPAPSISSSDEPRKSKPKAAAQILGPFDCLIPGCTGRATTSNGGQGFANLDSIRGHIRTNHKMKFKDYIKQYGMPEVVTEPQPLADDDKFKCGIDGCETNYPVSQYKRPAQALGIHRFQKHGIRAGDKQQEQLDLTPAAV